MTGWCEMLLQSQQLCKYWHVVPIMGRMQKALGKSVSFAMMSLHTCHFTHTWCVAQQHCVISNHASFLLVNYQCNAVAPINDSNVCTTVVITCFNTTSSDNRSELKVQIVHCFSCHICTHLNLTQKCHPPLHN